MAKKPTRGRPRKPAEERRDSVIYLKLTAPERAAVERAAGDRPITVWARERLLAAVRRALG